MERFDLAVLFEANSFSLLAELLRSGRPFSASPVAALRPGLAPRQENVAGEGMPLGCRVSRSGGLFEPLADAGSRAFAGPAGVLVEPDPYLPAGEAPNFAAIARLLIDTLKVALPSGPYALAGTCLMGALAQEMAVQLEQRGEPFRGS